MEDKLYKSIEKDDLLSGKNILTKNQRIQNILDIQKIV